MACEQLGRAPVGCELGVTYQEYRYWSVVLGCNAARISVADPRGGGEHFAIVPMNGTGRQNRLAREAALQAIAEHIAARCEPGEVEIEPAH